MQFLGIDDDRARRVLLVAARTLFSCSALLPLIFGGKVYNSLKAIMTVKIVYVLVFLTFLAVCFSTGIRGKRSARG